MAQPRNDRDRLPLDEDELRRELLVPGSPWCRVEVLEDTASTNVDVLRAAAGGEPEGLVVVSEHQSAGRGRVGRAWSAPPRSGLALSVLLRPPVAARAQWGWLPLLAGVSVATAVRRVADVEAALKWPNDVLVDGRKLAGILAEASGDAVVVGMGVNVSLREDELPVPTATSLVLAGATTTDRDTLLRAVLRELGGRYLDWCAADCDAGRSGLLAAYRELCATLGRDVVAHLPGGARLTGTARDVDATGRLLLDTDAGATTLAAADVVHLR